MNALIVEDKDNVAVATADVSKGEVITYATHDGERHAVTAVDDIQIYHKFAVRDIAVGSDITKYGECIGRAARDIKAGEHVHTHNVQNLS